MESGLRGPALTISLDRRVASSLAEVKFAIRTLLRIAGYGCRFVWRDETTEADISYGPEPSGTARLHIPASLRDFSRATDVDATGSRHWNGLPFLLFPGEDWVDAAGATPTRWPCDVVFAAFWFLVGARETAWRRDRWGNLFAHDWVPVRDGLLAQAPVSRWGHAIRDLFARRGPEPVRMPWESGRTRAAFSFTHDVDYPQLFRWIEAPRVLAQRGARGIGSAIGILKGTNHFWKFGDWVEFERRLGARPTFYFMARRGSLLQYALGRPDAFYDIRWPEFTRLFAELREAGCEIGLHASYLAYRSAETFRVEAERVSHESGCPVLGNRHHYWHLDPTDPNETLRRHELAGLGYDSSLELEFFPGFRRGICHPFHPFHPGERRELGIVEVPPAWMDDQFDGRLADNGVTDPDAAAHAILQTARETGGVAVVDYHVRGMNSDIFPRWGRWLSQFAERELDDGVARRTPGEIVTEFLSVERILLDASSDETADAAAAEVGTPIRVEVSAVTAADLREVADLHFELFGDPDYNGHSIATLGRPFLENVFYRLNLDNPDLHTIVARADGRVVGLYAYATRKSGVFGHMLRRHALGLATGVARSLLSRPATLPAFLTNLRYMWGEAPLPFLEGVPGWWVVAGVHPDARTARFKRRAGASVVQLMFDHMEAHMRRVGCGAWFAPVRPDNAAINAFIRRNGASVAGVARAQGLEMRYYVKRLDAAVVETRGGAG